MAFPAIGTIVVFREWYKSRGRTCSGGYVFGKVKDILENCMTVQIHAGDYSQSSSSDPIHHRSVLCGPLGPLAGAFVQVTKRGRVIASDGASTTRGRTYLGEWNGQPLTYEYSND